MLAIDPSSQLSGGSILGDKTRMTLSRIQRDGVYPALSIPRNSRAASRSAPARQCCCAKLQDTSNILVETVGVGQSETAVHDMVDFFLLITLAGAGDELQGMKRGVMELADMVAINKADGANLAAAERARARLRTRCTIFPVHRPDGRRALLPARRKPARASPSFGIACWNIPP